MQKARSTAARRLGPLLPAVVLAACGQHHAPFVSAATAPAAGKRDAGTTAEDASYIVIPPPPLPGPDAPGICGRTVVPVVVDRVNLYFIVDASGSMIDPIPDSDLPSKYAAAIQAIHDVLRKIGHRVWYGAALFPGENATQANICPTGSPAFDLVPGDDARYAADNEDGPNLLALTKTLAQRPPGGLTPTAATLVALKGDLAKLEGTTYAVLLTDGAPNCDANASCGASGCTANIEGLCPEPAGGSCCVAKYNMDNRWCLDADPTVRAVEALNGSGIKTFVVGMPGTAPYETLLDQLAVVGGTAQKGDHQYFPVQNDADLENALQNIGLEVAISCDVPLAEPPPDQGQVNVYFDQDVVPLDAKDGWTWTGESSIEIVGSYCSMLQTGSVLQVQVIAGCPSVTR